MLDATFEKFDKARKENDINTLRKLASETNDWNIILAYATLCYKRGKYDIAKTEFTKLLPTKKWVIASLNLGRIAIKEKDCDSARNFLEGILDDYKTFNVEYELGRLDLLMGNEEEAKKHFLNVLKEKNDAYTLFELGKIESKACNYSKAEKYFKKALKINKNDLFSKFELARVKNKMFKSDEAEKLLDEIISLKETKKLRIDGYEYLELVKCYLDTKQYKKARKILKKIYKAMPNDACVKYFYGILEFREKNYVLARQYFNEALDINYNESYEFFLGTTERLLGNYSSAEECLNNCLDKYRQKHQVLFELSMIAIRKGNFNKAINYLEEATSFTGVDKNLYKVLAFAYIKNNDFEKAALLIEKNSFLKRRLDREVLLYLSKNSNIFYKDLDFSQNDLSYEELQLLDYDEFVAIEDINDYSKSINDKEFNEIDLYSLFIILKDKLNKENKIERLTVMDAYAVKFKNILLKVITLPNTKDIISIYPIYDKGNIYNDEAVTISDISKEM